MAREGILPEEIFIKENAAAWNMLKEKTVRMRRSLHRPKKQEIDDYIILYNTVSNHLAYSRTYYGEGETTVYLNKLLGAAHTVIYAEKRTYAKSFFTFFGSGFPQLFRRYLKFFLIATAVFVLGGVLAYAYTAVNIENAAAFTDLNTITQYREEGQYDDPNLGMEIYSDIAIGTNNIRVCILAFVLGFTFGIGTLYVLITNGILIGVIAGIYFHKAQSLFFWSLIIPHGVPELFAIFLSGAAGLIIGYALINPKGLSRKDAFIVAARDAGLLLLGCIPILIIAAFVESFFTPLDIPYAVKYGFAAAELVVLVLYLCLPGRKKRKKRGVTTA